MEYHQQQFIHDIQETLQCIIPVCANCKKVLDGKGFWNRLETYISKPSEAKLRSEICLACTGELFHYG